MHRDAVLCLALALGALILYLSTLLPGIGSGDTAEFQRVAPTLGVAHPTGYPLYTMLGWLWSRRSHRTPERSGLPRLPPANLPRSRRTPPVRSRH